MFFGKFSVILTGASTLSDVTIITCVAKSTYWRSFINWFSYINWLAFITGVATLTCAVALNGTAILTDVHFCAYWYVSHIEIYCPNTSQAYSCIWTMPYHLHIIYMCLLSARKHIIKAPSKVKCWIKRVFKRLYFFLISGIFGYFTYKA